MRGRSARIPDDAHLRHASPGASIYGQKTRPASGLLNRTFGSAAGPPYYCCAVGAGDMDGGTAGPGPCASELSTHGAGQSTTTIEYEMRRLHDVVVTSFQHRETPDECSRINHAEPRDTERHPADRRGGKRPGSAA